jgi:hypothetical protein
VGGWELWAGSISDTDYQTRAGVFEVQEEFAEEIDPQRRKFCRTFLNIMDKGYRCSLAAWRTGRQLMMQPAFARSDRRFTSGEVLRSGAVAAHRSGNEWAVNVMKRSGLLKRGLQKRQSTAVIADAWLAWGFQVNFMYKPVL